MKGLYDSLPSSFKSEVLVRARQEDPEVQQARAELVKQKSPNQLSQINNLDEFPLPKTVESWMGRAPRPVERRKKFRALQRSQSANIQQRVREAMPESMKAQVLVKARIEEPEVLNARREIVQSKSVAELSQMASFSDFPIPTTIEKLMAKSAKSDISAVSGPPSFDV